MTTTFCLVGCGATKLAKRSRAKELYTGQLFRASRAYAERCAHWRILSARYGLLDPELRIDPYDAHLPGKGTERRQWARTAASGVCYELHRLGIERDHHVIILAGKDYAEHIMRDLDDWGLNCSAPLAGMQIGQRLQWLSRANLLAEGLTKLNDVGATAP